MVGWRGEPGEHDEPQHIFQGEVTIRLLEDMEITVYVLDKTTTEADIKAQMERFRPLLAQGKSVASSFERMHCSMAKKWIITMILR